MSFAYAQATAMTGGREMHAYLLVNGRPTKANFMGPGTDLVGRLKSGDKPVSGADKVAFAHDLRYTLANGDAAAERAADIKMVSKLKDSNLDNIINRSMGSIPIRSKMAAEDLGIISKGTFSKGEELSPEDRALVETKLSEVEMEGFGKPGARLRNMLKQRGGALPQIPADLPVGITQETINQIRQIAAALNVPHRAEEWLNKQNVYEWYLYMGVGNEEALAATFGNERPWDGVINQGEAQQAATQPRYLSAQEERDFDMMGDKMKGERKGLYADAIVSRGKPGKRKAPSRKSALSKGEFLERMAQGRANAKKRKKGTRKPAKKRFTPARKRAVAGKLRKVLRKAGRGLGLAGEGLKLAGSGFDFPESVSDYASAAKHLGDHVAKHFRITVPPDFIAGLGEEMSGMGMNWDTLDSRLSGFVPA